MLGPGSEEARRFSLLWSEATEIPLELLQPQVQHHGWSGDHGSEYRE